MNVENKTICWELLSTLDPQNISRLCISPSDGQKSFDLPGDHKILNCLHVDLVGHFPLTQLKGEIPHAHQSEVDRERHDREGDLDLVILLGVQYQEEQDHSQDVLEMEGCVQYEVPESKSALIPISIDLVRIFDLIGDDLVEFASFELHLLLIELVLDYVVRSLLAGTILPVSLLLVVDLAHGHRDRLPIVACTVVVLIIKHLNRIRLLQIFEAILFIRIIIFRGIVQKSLIC